MRAALSKWPFAPGKDAKSLAAAGAEQGAGDAHLDMARESLNELLTDARVPGEVRTALAAEYEQLAAMLDKLENGHVHIAVFGRVSVGKSALLNSLLGEARFSTSPLHGETKTASMAAWTRYDAGGVFLIDTPGINEVDGEARERLAHEVASHADLVLFVVDGDLTDTEHSALATLAAHRRPIVLVLNKSDRYREEERQQLIASLTQHTAGLVRPRDIVLAAAQPASQRVIVVDEQGREMESTRQPKPDVEVLRQRLWDILDEEGKSLVAVNASVFASHLSDKLALRITEVRRAMAQKTVRMYCVAKGIGVAFNPLPVADLFAAAVMDVAMVMHLSRVYGLPMTRREAGGLVQAIVAQVLALMGTVWAVHLVSSALKAGTGGLSTLITAGAQGAVAYYGTYVVGRVAERYLAQGKSWGTGGPKHTVREILESLDRDSILADARRDILARLKQS